MILWARVALSMEIGFWMKIVDIVLEIELIIFMVIAIFLVCYVIYELYRLLHNSLFTGPEKILI